MTQIAEKIFSEAMQLDESERAELAVKLMDTLEPSVDAGYDEEWNQEIEARIRDTESGRAKSIPLDQAMLMIRAGVESKTN